MMSAAAIRMRLCATFTLTRWVLDKEDLLLVFPPIKMFVVAPATHVIPPFEG